MSGKKGDKAAHHRSSSMGRTFSKFVCSFLLFCVFCICCLFCMRSLFSRFFFHSVCIFFIFRCSRIPLNCLFSLKHIHFNKISYDMHRFPLICNIFYWFAGFLYWFSLIFVDLGGGDDFSLIFIDLYRLAWIFIHCNWFSSIFINFH